MTCHLCGAAADLFGTSTVLGKYEATYLRCRACGFMQVDNPTWLDEAYSSAVSDVDIGVIHRMLLHAKLTRLTLHLFLGASGKYLDFGAGYGALVRRMRDLGYDFRWFDKHCDNIFAKGFEADLEGRFDVITAFEVFEHLQHPLATIEQLAARADSIVFSTSLIGQAPPPLDEWPYYAPETGQHIAFYTQASLERLATKLGMTLCTNGVDFHLMSRQPINPQRFRWALRPGVSRWLNLAFSRPTLLYSDYRRGREAAMNAMVSKPEK